MRFFYDSEALCEIRTLEKFTNLRELCLNGGDFAKDPLRELLENIGPQLSSLELNHVENIGRGIHNSELWILSLRSCDLSLLKCASPSPSVKSIRSNLVSVTKSHWPPAPPPQNPSL